MPGVKSIRALERGLDVLQALQTVPGASLREFTLARLMTSLHGLRDASPLDALSMP